LSRHRRADVGRRDLLEPGDDGVLGVSFLWHFNRVDNYDQTVTLAALTND
jgi:hypothetical protein